MQRTNYSRWVIGALLVWFLIVWSSGLQAATTSGSLVADETWSGVVELTGDVTVPAELTLTIEAGTVVVFPALADDTAGDDHDPCAGGTQCLDFSGGDPWVLPGRFCCGPESWWRFTGATSWPVAPVFLVVPFRDKIL